MGDDTKLYRLVFTGNVLPGHSRNEVVTRLQQMLHLDMEKASRLVAGKHKQINKKLTLDRAEKLRLLVLKQGAECVLLPIEESFVSTQQLPMFIRGDDISNQQNAQTIRKEATQSTQGQSAPQESISRIRKRSMSLSSNTKLKYLFYVIFLMVFEAVVIWNIKPVSQEWGCSNNSKNSSSFAGKASALGQLKGGATLLSAAAKETAEKLANISVRASLWFAAQGNEASPVDVSWRWIQGDVGISVHEMNDSWGNAIRYFGKEGRFELRSAGPDTIFYTADDIYMEMIL